MDITEETSLLNVKPVDIRKCNRSTCNSYLIYNCILPSIISYLLCFGLVIAQSKYAMDIIEEKSLLNAKPVNTPMDSSVKLLPNQGEPPSDSERYKRLVGKLNYFIVTCLDISFAVSVASLNSPCQEHMDVVIRIIRYIKVAPR